MSFLSRTEMLLGGDAIEKLRRSTVVIFGLGGVGSYTAEALVRCGVGNFTVVDGDVVCPTNINRQLIALQSTVGRAKADAAKERMLAINPEAHITAINAFVDEDNIGQIFRTADYVVDAIDTITSKLAIIEHCSALGIRVISSMGAGNKLHPERFMLADIYETKVCPLAKVMRKQLRERGVAGLKVCYSDEEPVSNSRPPSSISFVPATAGLIIAGQVVRDIID
ncbi:MAG: tRNA threonylcarbamoyladenosine dehydratase [Defluviitaleaceae bacterium]|nr:tRNA threonylcarbamoyladenosine dehydratase [Defluviitaleaceae bacterium]